MKEVCEMCGIEGEGATDWGGWCHDCDNHFEEGVICDECGEIHDEENEVMTIKEEDNA